MGQLHIIGTDVILSGCVLDLGRQDILWEFHISVVGGHFGEKSTRRKILQSWDMAATMLKDVLET